MLFILILISLVKVHCNRMWQLIENVHSQTAVTSHDQRRRGINKKSELLLMRRARAYSSFCSHVILVYLRPFCRNSLFCSQKSPKNH